MLLPLNGSRGPTACSYFDGAALSGLQSCVENLTVVDDEQPHSSHFVAVLREDWRNCDLLIPARYAVGRLRVTQLDGVYYADIGSSRGGHALSLRVPPADHRDPAYALYHVYEDGTHALLIGTTTCPK